MTNLTALISALPESEHEQGLRLQATRWAAVRGGSVAVWRRLQQAGERFVVTSGTPRTIGERLHVAAAAYEAARTGTAGEARELALQALADGRLLDDPGPESGAFWIAPSVLFFAYADDDAARVSTEVIEWANQHGSLPAFSMAAQLRAYASVRRGLLAGWCGRDEHTSSSNPLPRPFTPTWRLSTSCSRGARRLKRVTSLRRFGPSPPQQARSATCRRARASEQPPTAQRTRSTICSHAGSSSGSGKSARPRLPPGARTPRRSWYQLTGSTRLVRSRVRSSSVAAPSAHKLRSAHPCERLAFSSEATRESSSWRKRSRISSVRRLDSSTRSR